MKIPYNFTEYNLIENRRKKNYWFKKCMYILIVAIIIIICKFNFFVYQSSVLINDENGYLVLADIDMINTLSTTNKIIINNIEYDFSISKIADYTNINGTIYQSVYLSIDKYDSKFMINKCMFLKSKSTLIDSIVKFTKGG